MVYQPSMIHASAPAASSTTPRLYTVAGRAIAFARGASNTLAAKFSTWNKLKRSKLSSTTTAAPSPSQKKNTASSRTGAIILPALHGASISHSHRPGAPAGRRAGILWFRSDLRLDDNEALNRATAECSSVLPVYCFDPRDYGRSPQGYDRTGPYRATFLIQAVTDLRERLRAAGSDLIVRIGRPEEVLGELVRKIGAGTVYCHSEVTHEEQQVENRVGEAVKATGAQLRSFWTNTLHDIEALPFELPEMPQHFDKFRASMARLTPKAAVTAPEQLRALPVGASAIIQAGDIPSLQDLGLQPLTSTTATTTTADSTSSSSSSSSSSDAYGGESEALRQLKQFLATAAGAAASKGSTTGKVTSSPPPPPSGAAHTNSFSSSIAPWLATGCLSPRRMLEHAQSALQGNESAAGGEREGAGGGGTGGSLQWVQFELLWRDFFRLLTRRHSEVVLPRAKQAVESARAFVAPAFAMA